MKQTGQAMTTVLVSTYTDGILDPGKPMLGPVKDGGTIIANTNPGCWGPMMTPSLRGGHEVTQPVAVENAEPGDAIAIRIRNVNVTSTATASGNDEMVDGYFLGDPYVASKCPNCDTLYPETRIEGTGPEAIRCANCGQAVTPFRFTHGYTVVFDKSGQVGLTVDKATAERIAQDPQSYSACPENSKQNSVLVLAPADLVSTIGRMRRKIHNRFALNALSRSPAGPARREESAIATRPTAHRSLQCRRPFDPPTDMREDK